MDLPLENNDVLMDFFTVDEESAGLRLDVFLTKHALGHSRNRVKSLIESGCVTKFEQVQTDCSLKVRVGEVFHLVLPPLEDPIPKAQAIDLTILYEDAHLLVLDKPAGLVVHPAPGNPDHTLVNALIAHCGESLSGIGGVKRPGIVHRLDKETSGLMVVAKTDAAHKGLSDQFQDRTLSRQYFAFVLGAPMPPHGKIEKNIDRSKKDRKKMVVVKTGGRTALTYYQTKKNFGPKGKPAASLLLCKLQTGRTHQIRVHLHAIGYPIIGDRAYHVMSPQSVMGKTLQELDWKEGRQALHAAILDFIHPISQEPLHFESPLPEDLRMLEGRLNALSGL